MQTDTGARPVAPRIGLRTAVSAVLAVLTAVLGIVVLIRVFSLRLGYVMVATMAMLPYICIVGLILTVVCLLLRRWWIGGVAAVLALTLCVVIVPRALGGPDDIQGTPLRLMALNMYFGRADPHEVVDLVRREHIQLLSLEELTDTALQRLDQEGIRQLLPYRVVDPAESSGLGTGLLSAEPLRRLDLTGQRTTFESPSAQLNRSGQTPVQIVAFHARAPYDAHGRGLWNADMAALPSAGGPGCRVISGDFNATLDHPDLRKVLSRGYRDAADVVGAGLRPTWWGGKIIPPMVIDHVLVSKPCGVTGFHVVDVKDSDHHAVIATLVVPPA